MAKLYDKNSRKHAGLHDPQLLSSAIRDFLGGCRRPAVLDFGDEPLNLLENTYALEVRAGKLVFSGWDERRSLSRRILSADRVSSAILDCSVQRFGRAPGTLTFLDLDRPQTAPRALKGTRQSFAEKFRRILSSQFPGWEIGSLSSGIDLSRSFSPIFPRARLDRGHQHIAALACPSVQEEPAFLSFALLWYDYVQAQRSPADQISLGLFLPEAAGTLTAHRLRWLTGLQLRARLFRFNQHGLAGEVDPQDLGNLETRLSAHYSPPGVNSELEALFSRLATIHGVGCCPEISGAMSIRFHGLEFARIEEDSISLGIDAPEKIPVSQFRRIEEFAYQLFALKPSQKRNRSELPSFPERWFESSIRSHMQALDPELLPHPVHGQVLTFAGGERDMVDLLSISSGGRLAVIELKTTEDIHLPMQGLDYWMRIGWHAGRRELDHLFPGIPAAAQPPKLLLVAPALSFHPSNEIILRYFSPEIEVERIGVNSDWGTTLKVVFRLSRADLPISHQSSR